MKNSISKSFFIILIFCVILLNVAKTQDTSTNYRHEVGTDITGLISTMFGQGYSSSPDYNIMYKFKIRKSAIRFNLSGNYFREYVDTDSLISFNFQIRDKYDKNFGIRLGYERRSMLTDKWELFYGLDLLYSAGKQGDETLFSTYTRYWNSGTIKKGFAPFFGIRYCINDRVTLSTESFLSFINSTTTDRYFFDNHMGPNTESTDVKVSNNVNFYPPIALTISVRL